MGGRLVDIMLRNLLYTHYRTLLHSRCYPSNSTSALPSGSLGNKHERAIGGHGLATSGVLLAPVSSYAIQIARSLGRWVAISFIVLSFKLNYYGRNVL